MLAPGSFVCARQQPSKDSSAQMKPCYKNGEEESSLYSTPTHSMFFKNIILCNRCEAAAKLHLRVFYLILQTKVSRLSQETSLVHCGARKSVVPVQSRAEITVGLTVSVLGLKNTMLPCNRNRDRTSVSSHSLKKDKKTRKQ